jgi:hypothetical protein
MNKTEPAGFAERLKTAADAKKALLEKFRPKPTVTDPLFAERDAMRLAEVERVRTERAQAKAEIRQAAAETAEIARQAQAALDAEALEAKRGEKERTALTSAEAKAKRDARYAARKARS